MNKSLSHRWTLYVSQKSYIPFVHIFLALVFVALSFLRGWDGFFIFLSVFVLMVALAWVERRSFYEILKMKNDEIDELRKKIEK